MFSPESKLKAAELQRLSTRVTNPTGTVLVCLLEQNRLATEYLLHLLAKDSGICAFTSDRLLHGKVPRTAAPVFLLDCCGLALPVSQCLQRLRFRFPAARFIILDHNQSEQDLLRLLLLGIHGFVDHDDVARDLLSAVHTVANRRMHIPPEVLRDYVQCTATAKRSPYSAVQRMTQREDQIIELARRRLSNKEIADILSIQESTVKYHLGNIFSKLQITTRRALVEEYESSGSDWKQLLLLSNAE